MNKKRIGISWRFDVENEFCKNVVEAIEMAGGEAVILEQVKSKDVLYDDYKVKKECVDEQNILLLKYANDVKKNLYDGSNVEEVMKNIDAVIFTGGEDFCPTLYNEVVPWNGIIEDCDYKSERDINDLLLMHYCLDKDISIMGICRGQQLLSLIYGAKVIEDLDVYFNEKNIKYDFTHRNLKSSKDAYRDYAPHNINIIDENSKIYKMFNKKVIEGCPSWHHQVVTLENNENIKVTAVKNVLGLDCIEAVEVLNKKFAIGIQFHPEAALAKRKNNVENQNLFMKDEEAIMFFRAIIDSIEN